MQLGGLLSELDFHPLTTYCHHDRPIRVKIAIYAISITGK